MPRFPENDIMSLVGQPPRYDLAESTSRDLNLGALLPDNTDSLADLKLGYASAEGDARLRQIIADAHAVAPADVVLTMGGMHALFLLAFILCGRSSEAVIAVPVFPMARNVLEAVGTQVRCLPLSFERGYQPDLDALRGLLSARTRLVSLASPQNPSGVAVSAATLRGVLAAMDEKCPDAFLLVDETYREAAYGDDPVAASALALDPRVVSVSSLSKCHGAPGLRLGWAITRDAALRRQLVLGKFNTVLSCSPVDEALALRVFAQREHIIGERRRQLAAGLQATAAWVQANAAFVEWVRPDAGALCCVRLRHEAFGDAAVDRFYAALPAAQVRVGQGNWFGEAPRVFRVGFGLPPLPDLEAGLTRLSEALRRAADA
jgi:aspartate/methionine/tyrosine aminotransferase